MMTQEERQRALDAAYEVASGRFVGKDREALRLVRRAIYATFEDRDRARDRIDFVELATVIEKRVIDALASHIDEGTDECVPLVSLLRPPFLVTPLSWRTWYRSFEAEEAHRHRSEVNVTEAAEMAIASLIASKRARPPRLVVMQLVEHYFVRSEPLPPVVIRALAHALAVVEHATSVDRHAAVRRGREEGRPIKEIVAEAGMKERSTRARKPKVTVGGTHRRNIVLYDSARAMAEQGVPVSDRLRFEIAAALGLLNSKGEWRAGVGEQMRGGIREPVLLRAAARVEAAARLAPRVDIRDRIQQRYRERVALRKVPAEAGEDVIPGDAVSLDASRPQYAPDDMERARDEVLGALLSKPSGKAAAYIARALAKNGIKTDERKVARWMETPEWEPAVQAEGVWLLREKRTQAAKP